MRSALAFTVIDPIPALRVTANLTGRRASFIRAFYLKVFGILVGNIDGGHYTFG